MGDLIKTCPQCKGMGNVYCPVCNGDNYKGDCSGCGGKGVVKCDECNGAGKVEAD